MNPINIISGIAILLSLFANSGATKGGLKGTVTKHEKKPTTYLQKTPLNISALVLVLQILGVFQIGTLELTDDLMTWRIIGLVVYIIFSWLQVKSYKNLKDSYSQEIVIKKNHQLITSGFHIKIRHPQYLSQVISDLGLGIALCSYLVVPMVLLVELPLFVLRARKEEELLKSYFNEEFEEYKKKSSFMLPFIG